MLCQIIYYPTLWLQVEDELGYRQELQDQIQELRQQVQGVNGVNEQLRMSTDYQLNNLSADLCARLQASDDRCAALQALRPPSHPCMQSVNVCRTFCSQFDPV